MPLTRPATQDERKPEPAPCGRLRSRRQSILALVYVGLCSSSPKRVLFINAAVLLIAAYIFDFFANAGSFIAAQNATLKWNKTRFSNVLSLSAPNQRSTGGNYQPMRHPMTPTAGCTGDQTRVDEFLQKGLTPSSASLFARCCWCSRSRCGYR